MATLLVGYDLNRPGQDYERLIAALKGEGTWWHHLDSTWLVETDKTAVELRNLLRGFIDDDDELLVIDVSGRNWAGSGFADRAYAWLKKNM